ncbi:hypothetical protein BGX27_005414 [Mortierella sp. AM989]|nr:hypothetical protein BGX27_005414 [Mortierella sp. AM989]
MDSTDHTNQSEDVLARRGQDLQEEGPSIPLKYFQPQGTMQTGIIEAHPYDSNGSIWSECSEILRHSPMPQNQTVYPQNHSTNAGYQLNGYHQQEMSLDQILSLPQNMTFQAQMPLHMDSSLQAEIYSLQHVSLLQCQDDHPTNASHRSNGFYQHEMLFDNCDQLRSQSMTHQAQESLPMNPSLQAASDFLQALLSTPYNGPLTVTESTSRGISEAHEHADANARIKYPNTEITNPSSTTANLPRAGNIVTANPGVDSSNPTLPRRKGNIYAPQLRTDASASSLQHSEVEEPSGSNARKRRRNQITLEEKIAVVKYADMNPDATAIQLGKHFKLCRTTIYGIMSKAKELLAAELLRVPSSLNLCRLQEARFRILEELLVDWVKILWSQQICVPAKKIMAQGMEIYTMLSHFLSVPWEPCSFTSGWLKGFQRRQFRLASDGNEMAKKRFLLATPKNDLKSIRVGQYKMGDIYSCEMTGMNLNLNLPNLAQDKGRDMAICKSELSSVTIVACFNATGSDKREPLVLVRQAGFGILNTKRYHDMVDGTKTEDLINYTFFSWLIEFDSSLVRRTLLMVDEAIWNLLKSDCTDFQSVLKWIVVVKVPMGHAGSSPMSARIAKEFKSRYYFHLIEALNRQAQRVELNDKNRAKLNYLEDYLSLIKLAWEKIHHSTIKCLFQRFLKPIGLPADCSAENGQDFLLPPDNYSNNLFNALRSFFPDAKDTVIQHFVYFDKDTGPSSSLRRGIYRMHRHPDFSNSFRNVGESCESQFKIEACPVCPSINSWFGACANAAAQSRSDPRSLFTTVTIRHRIMDVSNAHSITTEDISSVTTSAIAILTNRGLDIISHNNSFSESTTSPTTTGSTSEHTFTTTLGTTAATGNAIPAEVASTTIVPVAFTVSTSFKQKV